MGVPVMELFLVCSADGTKRKYEKGVLAARRTAKDFGKGSTLKPVKVTLTKDGVLEALNAVPFNRRVQAAPSLRPVTVAPVEAPEDPPVPLGPPPVRPVDPYTIPDPEDAEHLKGKHPDHIRGWNKVKHRGTKRVVT